MVMIAVPEQQYFENYEIPDLIHASEIERVPVRTLNLILELGLLPYFKGLPVQMLSGYLA
eukprot:2486260-Amphidinium_carterae.1